MPKIDRYLEADDNLRPLVAKAREIRTLDRLCLDFLPPGMAHQIRTANLRNGELSLLADNPAAAAKLKLVAESLRKFLLQQGTKVNSVSVRVQPTASHRARPAGAKAAALSAGGLSELSVLYERLSPTSPARRALGTLLESQGVRQSPAGVPRKAAATRGRAGRART